MNNDWMRDIPIYVTRETANGYTGTLSVAAWFAWIMLLLLQANVIIWGVVGIVEGVKALV